LVFGALTANSNTGTVTPGSSQTLTFMMRSASGKSADADVLKGNAGAQDARFTVANNVTWYAVAATFVPASGTADRTPPSTPASGSPAAPTASNGFGGTPRPTT
jgi:hypothetical protein